MPRPKKKKAKMRDREVPGAPNGAKFELTPAQRDGLERLSDWEQNSRNSPIVLGGPNCICHRDLDRK